MQFVLWMLTIANGVAVIGCLWLVRAHRLSIRKANKEIENEEKEAVAAAETK